MRKKWFNPFNLIIIVFILLNIVCIGVSLFEKKTNNLKNVKQNQNVSNANIVDTGASLADVSEKGGAIFLDYGDTMTINYGFAICDHNNRFGSAIYEPLSALKAGCYVHICFTSPLSPEV